MNPLKTFLRLSLLISVSLVGCSHNEVRSEPVATNEDVKMTEKQPANQTFYDRAGAPQQCAPPKDTAGAPAMCTPRDPDEYFVKACSSAGFTMVTCGGCVTLCTGKPANP